MNSHLIKKAILASFIAALIMFLLNNNGYFFSESKAIQFYDANVAGEAVYEQKFDNQKLVVRQTSRSEHIYLLELQLGMLIRVIDSSILFAGHPFVGYEDDLLRTWSASLNANKMYDTLIAVKVNNSHINKVIISNDYIEHHILRELESIKNSSTFYAELDLVNGYAATYLELKPSDAGGFVFRGINDKDEIIYASR